MTSDILAGFAAAAPEHRGPLVAETFVDEVVVRCSRCGDIAWRSR
jgi:hypothetical protein